MENKLLNLLLASSILLMFGACTKEGYTESYAKITNNSSVKIKVTAFRDGIALNGFNFELNNNELKDATENTNMGLGLKNNPGFNNENLSQADSVIIIYNDSFSVTHYRDTPLVFAEKYYLTSNPRCFMNIANWSHEYVEESKTKAVNYYDFTFTQQDYADAKK